MVGDKLALALRGQLLGAVTASMQEVMLESPVRGEVIPTVVFLLPAVMSEAADQRGGKCALVQGGKPQPFVLRVAGLQFSLAVVILREGSSARRTRTGSGLSMEKGSPSVSQSLI